MLASGLICPEAQFTPEEQALIVPPLVNMLRRMPAESIGAAAAWIDPVLLCFGLIVWGKRVMSITKPPKEPETMPLEEATRTHNGYSPTDTMREAEELERARNAMGATVGA